MTEVRFVRGAARRCCEQLERVELYRRTGEAGQRRVIFTYICPVHGALGRELTRRPRARPPRGGIRGFKRSAVTR